MVFTVLVAADLFGNKTNYELDFLDPPAMAELRARLEAIFGLEAQARRPAGIPQSPFQGHRMQVFDDKVELWVDLVSAGQLHDYCQVYVFQRESPWHKEVQSKIPPPVKPPIHAAGMDRGMIPAAVHGGVVHAHAPVVLGPPPVVPLPPILGSPTRAPHSPVGVLVGGGVLMGGSPALLSRGSPYRLAPAPVGSPYRLAPAPVGSPYRQAPAPVALTADLPNRPPLMVRQETTHGDKVRCVYDDLDKARNGAVRQDDFIGALERLRIDLAGKSDQIFVRADMNKDNVLSFPEFERFAELYPTVLDSLFYRNRDYWIDRRQKDGIESANRVLNQLRDREAQARQAADEAAAGTAAHQQQCRIQEAEAESVKALERESQSQSEAARAQTEEARQRAAQRASAVAAAREKEREAGKGQSEAQYALEAAKSKQGAAGEELGRAERRLQDLERMIQEQGEEVAKQRELVGAAAGTTEQANAKVGAAARDLEIAQSEARVEQDQLAEAERETQWLNDRERDLAAALAKARDTTSQALAKKDQDERELGVRKAKEDARRQAEGEAAAAAQKQNETIRNLEGENSEHNEKRLQTESEEQGLIANEVRIRDQRETLEKEEALLRDSHRNFHASTGRSDHQTLQGASPARAVAVHNYDPSTSPRRLGR